MHDFALVMITALVEDPFEGFSDLSEDDFNAITRATQFMGLSPSGSTDANDTTLVPINREVQLLRDELHQARYKAESLEKSLLQLHQEKMTKEGEVAILRDRLQRIEGEKNQLLMKTYDRLKESEGSRRTLEEEYRRTVNGLRTEIVFKDQEIESLTSAMQGATINADRSGFIPEGFEDITNLQRKRTAPPPVREERPRVRKELPQSDYRSLFLSERELLDEAFACVEYDWDISKLMDYDFMAILKHKADLQKWLGNWGALFVALEISYDKCLEGKREIVFRYIVKVIATCLALDEQLSLSFYNRTPYPRAVPGQVEGSLSQFLVKVCKYLNSPPFGTPPSLLKGHIDIIRMILANATNAIPLEVKELLEAGILQRFLYNQIDRDSILLACISLMEALSVDRNAVGLLLKQCPAPVSSSMLALAVKVAIERLQKETNFDDGTNEKVILRLIDFLCGLSKRNLVPINVAFDRRLLYELVDWLHRKVLEHDHLDGYEPVIEVIYYVFMEKGCDLKANIESRTFALHFIMQRLLHRQHLYHAGYSDKLTALMNATARILESWVEEREANRIDPDSFEKINVNI